jgi:hypothetical protein
LYATGAACAWDLAAHWVGISIPVNTSNASVLNDQKGRMPGVLTGGAAVTGGELVLGGAGQYVSLPTAGYGTTKGFTLVVSFTPTSVSSGTQQVLAAFGTPTASGGGLELGINGTYPYVANRGQVFTSASAVTAGTLSTISVVCAANRRVFDVFCFSALYYLTLCKTGAQNLLFLNLTTRGNRKVELAQRGEGARTAGTRGGGDAFERQQRLYHLYKSSSSATGRVE